MNEHHSFRDRLLDAGSPVQDSQQQIQKEIHNMLNKKLTVPRKLAMGATIATSLASGGVCGFLALTEHQLPLLARAGLATGTLFALAWILVLGSILRRGSIQLLQDARRIAQMVWTFTVLMVVFFVLVGMTLPDRTLGLMMIAQALVFLILAAVYWLTWRIEAAELNVRERLLNLELQVAELNRRS